MAKQVYPLSSLLHVREHRENTAQRELALARQEKENAQNLLLEAENALVEYAKWLKNEEKIRYDALIGQSCTKKDFDDLKNSMAKLMEREIELGQEVEKAKEYLKEREEILIKCKNYHIQMQKDKEKILAHKDLWQEEILKEEVKAEDAELEEFKPAQHEDLQ